MYDIILSMQNLHKKTPAIENENKLLDRKFTTAQKVNYNPTVIDESQPESTIRDSVIEYFKTCTTKKELPQLAGLLIHLGIDRTKWSAIAEKYPVIASRASHLIEKVWVEKLLNSNSTGAMFYLKNNYKDIYRDKSETDITLRTPKPILEGVEPIVVDVKDITPTLKDNIKDND